MRRPSSSIIVLPSAAYHAGHIAISPVNVPPKATFMRAVVDVTEHDDPKVEWALSIDISQDDDRTWTHLVGTSRLGGIAIHPTTHRPLLWSAVQVALGSSEIPRKIRGVLVLSHKLRTSIALEWI